MKENFGDLLSKYIVEKISNKKVIHVDPTNRWVRNLGIKHYLAIGSIINKATKKSIVWGSGIIKKDQNIRESNFVAVRGPKTSKRIEELGYETTYIYGDPGILSNLFYRKEIKKKYKYGIIPHYVDYKEIKKKYSKNNSTLVIDLMCSNVEDIFEKVKSCEFVFTTSLHGVIISHCFNIPALWIKFSDKLAGDNVKFYDYFESVGLQYPIVEFSSSTYELEDLINVMNKNNAITKPKKGVISKLQKNLIIACPFIKEKRKTKLLLLIN
ncbi:polysaccharide pyruvyl transferase family protein [Polaribacter uvawellassae]|uniref:polysaccharide pyruvyl transferase family protein n=1 Tax=Polaribacter uvawellassae TaxID=3133495 RepID=UPI00321A65AF